MSPLEAALDKLLIADIWRLLGLPRNPPERDKSVRSPFRDDKHPSFSIFDKGRRYKDHGTGEQGNAADFLAKARNLSNGEACRELIRLAGTSINGHVVHHPVRRDDDNAKAALRAKWPKLRTPTRRGIEILADLREVVARRRRSRGRARAALLDDDQSRPSVGDHGHPTSERSSSQIRRKNLGPHREQESLDAAGQRRVDADWASRSQGFQEHRFRRGRS